MNNLDEMITEAPFLTFEPFAQAEENKTDSLLRRPRKLRKFPRWF